MIDNIVKKLFLYRLLILGFAVVFHIYCFINLINFHSIYSLLSVIFILSLIYFFSLSQNKLMNIAVIFWTVSIVLNIINKDQLSEKFFFVFFVFFVSGSILSFFNIVLNTDKKLSDKKVRLNIFEREYQLYKENYSQIKSDILFLIKPIIFYFLFFSLRELSIFINAFDGNFSNNLKISIQFFVIFSIKSILLYFLSYYLFNKKRKANLVILFLVVSLLLLSNISTNFIKRVNDYPYIIGLSKSEARMWEQVKINGKNFGEYKTENDKVYLHSNDGNIYEQRVVKWLPNQIVIIVDPNKTPSGKFQVVSRLKATNLVIFNYEQI